MHASPLSRWNDFQRISIDFHGSLQCNEKSINLLKTFPLTINNSKFRGKPHVFHDPEFLVMPWETDEIFLSIIRKQKHYKSTPNFNHGFCSGIHGIRGFHSLVNEFFVVSNQWQTRKITLWKWHEKHLDILQICHEYIQRISWVINS